MLNRDLVLLSRFCDEVDGVSFTSLRGRIAFQKRIYLLQALGVDLGYRFSWDLYGPYSRGLAVAGDELSRNLDAARQLGAKLQMKPTAAASVAAARVLMQTPEGTDEGLWLEFVASLHYLKEYRRIGSAKEGFEKLRALKPHMSQMGGYADEAWERLERGHEMLAQT